MKISTFEHEFKNIILKSITPIQNFSFENGVRYLITVPYTDLADSIYVGLLSEWETLYSQDQIKDGNTYLICTDNDNASIEFPEEINSNIILVYSTVRSLLQKITILLEQQKHTESKSIQQIYYDFWDDMMQGYLINHDQTIKRIEEFPYPIKKSISCIVIRPSSHSIEQLLIPEIEKELKEVFPKTNLFYKDEEWIIIYTSESYCNDEILAMENFLHLLEEYQLNAGVSYAGHWPELLRTLYLTASSSINLGLKIKKDPKLKRIYTYNEYNPYYVIHLCAQKFIEVHNHDRLIYLVHPDIIELYFYDKKHRSNLLNVLYCYLMNGHNITLTAQACFMHRNTVTNKLAKIQQMIHNDLDDGESQFQLLLSCMIVEYQKNYVNKQISTAVFGTDKELNHEKKRRK